MFLRTLDYEGHTWAAELRVIPSAEGARLLEFSFSRAVSGGNQFRVTWRVRGDSLEALSEQGVDVSEDLLRRQLVLALAEARSVSAPQGP